MHVLLVKMSSLGDVVHALPAVTDAAGHGVRFDWVVEEGFSDIPARHPAVVDVLPIAWRRWRRSLVASRGEMAAFARRLRQRRYDLVLDAQGLVKSGVVVAVARGQHKAGFAIGSARESAAAAFYEQRHRVARQAHAVDRIRRLFASALHYTVPQTLDFGLAVEKPSTSTCVFLHGTTWTSKLYPEAMWTQLCAKAESAGYQVALPWGTDRERLQAERIAAATHATVWPRLCLHELIGRLASAALVIGVDSGLTHLSAALGVPTVVIYGSTDSNLTGCRGRRVANLQAEFRCAPCLQRQCSYADEGQQRRDPASWPPCYGSVAPGRVWSAAMKMLGGGDDRH